MWARAALVCIISIYVLASGLWLEPAIADRSQVVAVTEFCGSAPFEPVMVTNFAPNIEKVFRGPLHFYTKQPFLNPLSTLRNFSPWRNYVAFALKAGLVDFCVFEIPILSELAGGKQQHFSRGQMADVLYVNGEGVKWFVGNLFDTMRAYADIGALEDSCFFRLSAFNSDGAIHQVASGPIQKPSGNEKTSGEQRNERVSYLEPVAKERRPELGSLLASVLTLVAAFFFGDRRGAVVFAPLLIVYSVIGLLLGLDLWSLLRRAI